MDSAAWICSHDPPRPVLVGDVAYDPKVVTIWEIIKAYFEDHGTPMDFVFYSNYGLLVTALLDGVRAMTLAEMLDYVEDKAGFERLLATLDAPAYAITNPTCVGQLARREPLATDELAFAIDLINRVTTGLPVRTALHVCRGNWSRDERTLLSGGYAPLQPTFDALRVDELVLEYATPRAGPVIDPGGKALGLGVVNPRTDEIEPVDEIVARIRTALDVVPIDRLSINPHCGFGTFALRPMNDRARVEGKLRAMAAAARVVRADPEGPA